MKTINILVALGLIGAHLQAVAQNDSGAKLVNYKIGIYYSSHLHYYGRTDSVESRAAFPMAEIWLREKFYINAAPVFTIDGSGSQYAGTVSTIGYMKARPRSLTHVFILKPWYKSNSNVFQSALKAQLAASYMRRTKLINLSLGADARLSQYLDAGVSLGLDHAFRKPLGAGVILVVDPTANLYAGTQRLKGSRYEKSNFLFLPGPGRVVEEDINKFRVLSYEISVPLVIVKGKCLLLLTPSYIMPRNLIVVEGRPDLCEQGENTFYVTAGIKVSLR